MADLVMGALGSLIPKLYKLLEEEYCLQTGVKQRICCLTNELEVVQAALCKVAQVPWDQLDEQVQLWAREVKEASYNMEDVLDTFLVRVRGPRRSDEQKKKSLLKPLKKMSSLLNKSKARHKINIDVNDIMSHLQEVTDRCRRYMVDDIVARTAKLSTVDPRLHAMYTQVNKLVGFNEPCRELMSKLQLGDMKMRRIVSIVGVGGLGKTTLAKAVYDKLKGNFDSMAFVPIGRKPDLKKIFKDILIDLDRQRYLHFSTAALDERQLIDELRNFFLEHKRYLIIIDDIWEIDSWETIKLAMDGDINSGGRIVITTRNMEVARIADEIYKLQPLLYDSSRELLFTRIAGSEAKYVDNQTDETSDKFLGKCGGIPLAIITMASLLAGKQREQWLKLYDTFDFVSKDNMEAGNTMRILSFSYYDLPLHLRTCLLYLSAFPEDSVIDKGSLVWMWVGEGFIQENEGVSSFEIGEGYFNDLINRSMIQAVESNCDDSNIFGCRVHDMVLDFIRSKSREENFFMVLDNGHGTQLQNNVRRLANHSIFIDHANHFQVPKLRSFVALSCAIEKWTPLSSFTLLRVLTIENCKSRDDSAAQVEHIRHLLHLRFLNLSRTRIARIPEEIGALRFLQTLDLWESHISELPSWNSLPKQLARLRITLNGEAFDCKVFSVEGMTSLEELAINAWKCDATRRLVKELGSLRELRVLNASILYDEETRRDLVESLRHLHKLQTLTIYPNAFSSGEPWQATELVLPCHLRHLCVYGIKFYKLPSCINPSCLPNLSHLDLRLEHMDDQDLKTLGGLPELRYLGLSLFQSAMISNISDACYFPKLRCCRLPWSMALFVPNKEDKTVSFHIWNGIGSIGIMPLVSDDELERPRLSFSDDELQSSIPPMPSVSDDGLHRTSLQKLQHGIVAVSYNLHAVFQLVLVFVKRWSLQKLDQYTSISNRGSTPTSNREDPIAMPFVSDDDIDDTKNDSIRSEGAAAPPFMQSLQVLHFEVRKMAVQDHPNCCHNLGLEYLSSLREINVDLSLDADSMSKVTAALRHTAQVHPNRPTLCIQYK